MSKAEAVVLGFPKCGTSALMRALEADSDFAVLRTEKGALEMFWPMILDQRPRAPKNQIVAHKFTAYIYNRGALGYLYGVNPVSAFVLCIRHPARVLVSWHRMHQNIATTGKQPNHFAYKNRDFYASCSIEDYYQAYARSMLEYDRYFRRLISIVPEDRIIVASQERMAQGIGDVAAFIKAWTQGERPEPPIAGVGTDGHKGYADKAKVEVDPAIIAELDDVQSSLLDAISKSKVTALL